MDLHAAREQLVIYARRYRHDLQFLLLGVLAFMMLTFLTLPTDTPACSTDREVRDYALLSHGGGISTDTISYHTNYTFNNPVWPVTVRFPLNPNKLLSPGNQPGDNYVFHGSTGNLTVTLGAKVRITEVTLELKLDGEELFDSAPQSIELWASETSEPQHEDFVLLQSAWLNRKHEVQSFKIKQRTQFHRLRVRVLANFGNHYTSLYGIRVFGHE